MIFSILSQTWCCTQLWWLATSSRAPDSSTGSSTLHWVLDQTTGPEDDPLQHVVCLLCIMCNTWRNIWRFHSLWRQISQLTVSALYLKNRFIHQKKGAVWNSAILTAVTCIYMNIRAGYHWLSRSIWVWFTRSSFLSITNFIQYQFSY